MPIPRKLAICRCVGPSRTAKLSVSNGILGSGSCLVVESFEICPGFATLGTLTTTAYS